MSSRDGHLSVAHSYAIAAAFALLLLALWETVSWYSERASFLLSSPSQVWDALVSMLLVESLLTDLSVTASEALLGTLTGTLLGSVFGLALWLSRRAAAVAAPFIVLASNFPVFALAPAAIVWLGIGMGMKVFLAAFATFFVSLSLTHQGAKAAMDQFGGVFDGFKASPWDMYRKIIVPGALDTVFSSMRVNVGLGLLGAFIGEFIASERGLGRAIVRASGLYQMDRVLAASLCIIVVASVFDYLALGVQRDKRAIARVFGIPRRLRLRSRLLASRLGRTE